MGITHPQALLFFIASETYNILKDTIKMNPRIMLNARKRDFAVSLTFKNVSFILCNKLLYIVTNTETVIILNNLLFSMKNE